MILLASGDAFLLSQEAGNGNTYSYTATADLIMLNWGITSAGDINLGTWVNAQRQNRKKNKLTFEQIKRLNELGFIWDATNTRKDSIN